MEDLRTKIEALGENLPKLATLLKTLGLGLLDESQYKAFLQGPGQGSFPVLHDAAFWALKLIEGHLLARMTILQVQSQMTKLAHMVVHLASHDQIALCWEPDSASSPLQNSYLLLIALSMDVLPVGALRPFEPLDMVEMGLIGLLHDMPNRVLSHAEHLSLAAKLERQHHKLRSILPIACAEVDFCVAGGLFLIFCILSDEQRERVVIRNGIFREKIPVFHKSRHRTPLFLVTLYPEVVNNSSTPILELYVWGLEPVGLLVKKYLMELFQDPDIAPMEMCMVLAALLALSDTFFLGKTITSQCSEYPIDPPYQRPTILNFYKWFKQPSNSHCAWDVIETLMCSFEAVFAPPKEWFYSVSNTPILQRHQPSNRRLTDTRVILSVLETTSDEDDGGRGRSDGYGGLESDQHKGLDDCDPVHAASLGPGASQSLVNVESVTMIESDEKEPSPAYLPSSLSDSPDMYGQQVPEAGVGKIPQGKQREEPSQTLRRGSTQSNPEG